LALAPSGGSAFDASNRDVPRILIVEDDYLISGDMEAELAAAGFEIVGVARSATDAIGLAIEQRPNLVIMDIRLEGARDGVEAAVEIFKACGIRSLFASAYSHPETRRRAEPSLPLGWIAKPYTMGSLVEAVRSALRSLDHSKGKS
jgi:DNA-binding NarL/FixJ family response regulator